MQYRTKKLAVAFLVSFSFLPICSVAYAAPSSFYLYPTATPGCMNWAASGLITPTGSACGSGGGGGGSGSTWATTTSAVPGILLNYSLNNSDVVIVGSNSTSTAKFIFDPNTLILYAAGNVGIGTKSPTYPLDVVGLGHFTGLVDAQRFTATSSSLSSSFPNASTTALSVSGQLVVASTSVPINTLFSVGSTTPLALTINQQTGYLGFGTSSPEAPFTMAVTNSLTRPDFIIDGQGASQGAEMEINRSSAANTESNIDFNTNGVNYWQLGLQNNGTNDFELWDGLDNPVYTINQATNDTAIGTTTASAELTVWGDSVLTDNAFNVVSVASSTLFVVGNNGNIGMGTSTPNWSLQLSNTSPSFTISDSDAGTNLKHIVITNNNDVFVIGTTTDTYGANKAELTINATSNVGIGTTSPTTNSQFSVVDTVNATNILQLDTPASLSSGNPVFVVSKGGTLTNVGQGNFQAGVNASANGSGGAMIFTALAPSGQNVDISEWGRTGTAAVIDVMNKFGNIGIGTSTSYATLTVQATSSPTGGGGATTTLALLPGISGTGNLVDIYSTASPQALLSVITKAGLWGISTTSPQYPLTVFSATSPQLSLSDGFGVNQWVFRNDNAGNLTISTTTLPGTATTTIPALQLSSSASSFGLAVGSSTAFQASFIQPSEVYIYPPIGTIPFQIGTTSTASTTLFQIGADGRPQWGGGTPVPTCSGTCTLDAHSNDTAGTINVSGIQTSITLTFQGAAPWAPHCIASDNSTANQYEPTTISTTAVTFTVGVSIGTGYITYFCPL